MKGHICGCLMAVISILQNTQITGIRALTGMMQHQLREETSKNGMDI